MTMKQLLLVQFVGVMMLSSCTTYGVRKELSDIESYIMERPDSALTMLEAMDRNDLEQERDKARHALLHAMALDKNYIDVSDDSIAQVAVDYYSKHGLEKYKARSFYYLGIAYYYQKNYAKAILEFTKAEQAAIKSDSLYLGMSLLAQADAYSHTYNDAEELKCLNRANDVFENLGAEYYRTVVQLSLARLYGNIDRYEEADCIYDSLLARGELYHNLKPEILVNKAFMKMKQSDPKFADALLLYDELDKSYACRYMALKDYWSWAYALHLSGNKIKSENLVKRLSEVDTSVVASFWKYRIYRSDNDYENALRYLEKSTRQHNSAVDSLLRQSLSSAQRDYFRSQAEISEYRLAIKTMWIVIILAVSLLAISLISVIVHRRIRIEQEEKEKILQYIDEINRQFNIPVAGDAKSLKAKFIALYKSRFETLGVLCNQYFAHEGYEGAERLMYKRVWSLIEDIRNDKVRREKFEKLLDEELNGIMSNLRTEMPKLNEQDYALFSYIISGFDLSAISRLLDMSLNNVYAHKRRLRVKIEKKQPPHALQYLEMMC